MKKTVEKTKTAIKKVIVSSRQMTGVMSAVKAVVGNEQDTFDGVDEHPGSLDLPVQRRREKATGPPSS